mgnify:FL=1
MVITLRSPNDPFVKAQDITSCSMDFGVTAATYQLYSYYALAAAVGAFLSASWLFYVSKKLFREARDNANLNASDPVTGNAQAKYAVSPVVLKDTPETQRKASSVWSGQELDVGHGRERLDSPQAWSADTNDKGIPGKTVGEWYGFNFGDTDVRIKGLAVNGRFNQDQLVKTFNVRYYGYRGKWMEVDGGKVFKGNFDRDT